MTNAQHSIPAGEPRLGIIAKSIHTPQSRGEIVSAVADRKTRFKLQRKAQSILYKHHAEHPREQFRVCWCHRNLNNIDGLVGVFRKRNGSGARFSNIGTCGSVWHCPVCAVKVAQGQWLSLRDRRKRSRESDARTHTRTLVRHQYGRCTGRTGTKLERDVIPPHGTQAHHQS